MTTALIKPGEGNRNKEDRKYPKPLPGAHMSISDGLQNAILGSHAFPLLMKTGD